MPERSNVSVFEDDEEYQEMLKKYLERAGHTVVFSATSRIEAETAIKKFKDKGIQVAIVDGNLTEDDSSGDDGAKLTEKIREADPDIIVIGFSSLGVRGADVQLMKFDVEQVGKVVTNL